MCVVFNNFYISGVVFTIGMFCDRIGMKKWTMMPETEGETDCSITGCKEFGF